MNEFKLFRTEPVTDKPGCVRHVGMCSYRQMQDAMERRLKACGLFEDLDYFSIMGPATGPTPKPTDELPMSTRHVVFFLPGACEGTYLHVESFNEDASRNILFIAKTLQAGRGGLEYMAKIAVELSQMLWEAD